MRFELRCPSLIMSHPKKRHWLLLIIHAPDQFSLKSPSSDLTSPRKFQSDLSVGLPPLL